MLDRKQLEALRNVDITKVDCQALVDINNVIINDSLSSVQKMESYITQVKNPYCFLCGKTPIRIRFVVEDKILTQSLGNYFAGLK